MEAFDLIDRAAMICDGAAQILYINRQAEAILGPDFVATARAIDFDGAATEARFADMVQRALALEASEGLETRLVVRQPLSLSLRFVPLVPDPPPSSREGLVLVLIMSQPEEQAIDVLLAGQYRLTAAEIRVVLLMTDGASIAEIAEQKGVRPATVRSQLKSIFAKMNIHRQSQLVALISRLRSKNSA